MSRLRVMHVMEATDGGTCRYLEEVLPALRAIGIDVELVCSVRRNPRFRDVLANFRAAGIRVVEVDMVRNIRPFRDAMSLFSLMRVLRRSDADIYHFHSSKAGALGRLAASVVGRRPRVYTPHAYSFLSTPNDVLRRFYLLCERFLSLVTDHYMAVSESERLVTLGHSLASYGHVSTVNNGISAVPSISELRERREHRESDQAVLRIGYLGRLEPQKQPFCAMRVAAILVKQGLAFSLDVAGEGSLLPACKRLSRENGLDKHVRFLGHIDATGRFYRSVDVLLHTALCEGMPYAILDAMSWEVPVVGYDVHGVHDAVVFGQTGLLAKPGDEEELARHIVDLGGDRQLRCRLGQAARERVVKHFTGRQQIQAMAELYQSLANGRSAGGAPNVKGIPVRSAPGVTRILFVSHSGRLGGAERSMLELSRSLDPSLVLPFVACPVPSPLATATQEYAQLIPFPFCQVRRPARLRSALSWAVVVIAGVVRLIHCITRHRIDLVHANSTVSQLCAGPAAALTGIPSVWHWRDFYDDPRVNRLLARLTGGCVAISRSVRDFAVEQIDSAHDLYLVTNGVADKHVEEENQDDSKGLWSGSYRRDAWGLSTDHVIGVMLGQVVQRKGHDLMIDAISVAVKEEPSLRLVLAYPVDSLEAAAEVRRIKRLAYQRKCSEYLIFAGDVSFPERLLRACDFAVVPSRREPFGRVAAEAMFAGKPVIAADVDGLAEIVVDDVTGILVKAGSATELAQALVILAGSPILRRSMGQAGRQRAIDRFSVERVGSQMMEVYRIVLARHRKRGRRSATENRSGPRSFL